jgi:2,4-dienoyl-CoA reductase-like NADH-dependent reductase (Old Yellow Enzyme family)/thioredoxin reductase
MARARAGVGYIVLGGVYVHENGKGFAGQLGIHSDSLKPGLTDLVRSLGSHSRVGVQLSFKSLKRLPEHFALSEIDDCRRAFAQAAVRAVDCGFDAVELHACHDYWLNYFLSPHFNHRHDEYGGSLENRFRLLREVLLEIHAAVGNSILVGTRLSMEEFVEDGLTLEETLQAGKWLEELGVDYISASGGIGVTQYRMSPPMEIPRGSLLYLAHALKKTVSIPVIGVGRLDRPEFFKKAIEEEHCDIAGVGRALIADPEYVAKILDGRDGEIRPCLACNFCLVCLHKNEGIQCAVNPLVGRDLLQLEPLAGKLKVLVVGAGPAGLSAAGTAARRGAEVRVLEKKDAPGGLLNVACIPPHKEALAELTRYLAARATEAGAEIAVGRGVEAQEIREMKPDRVIIATGSSSIFLRVDGLENNPRVVVCEDLLLSGEIVRGHGYVVVGGGAAGLETAEYIAQAGGEVTVIEMMQEVGKGLHSTRLNPTLERLKKFHARIMSGTRLQSVDGGTVRAETHAGVITLGPFDHIVLAVGYKSEAGLAKDLAGEFPLQTIGDARQPRSIYEAVKEGFDAALDLDSPSSEATAGNG